MSAIHTPAIGQPFPIYVDGDLIGSSLIVELETLGITKLFLWLSKFVNKNLRNTFWTTPKNKHISILQCKKPPQQPTNKNVDSLYRNILVNNQSARQAKNYTNNEIKLPPKKRARGSTCFVVRFGTIIHFKDTIMAWIWDTFGARESTGMLAHVRYHRYAIGNRTNVCCSICVQFAPYPLLLLMKRYKQNTMSIPTNRSKSKA